MENQSMDKIIEKRSWIQRHFKWIIVGLAVLSLFIYMIFFIDFGKSLRVESTRLNIATVTIASFLEYLDVEGIVHPISVVKINALEDGAVRELLIEEGTTVSAGDIIMLLDNTDLRRQIAEEEAELDKQRINYREKIIEMEQSNINLRKQMLQAGYEADNVRRKFQLDKQEYQMGVMSRARFEIAEKEYEYMLERNKLTLQELKNDSITREIRIELMKNELQRQVDKFGHSKERLLHLEIRAPIDGQLSLTQRPEIGQQIVRGQNIGEVKVVTRFKLSSKVSEFYAGRIIQGLNAYIIFRDKHYNMTVSRVSPEIKDNKFDVDFLFTDAPPENLNLGKNFRIQIELSQPEEKIIIPRGTFYQNTGGQWIFKLDESGKKAYRQFIVLGRQNPAHYEVLEGVIPGDRVIISGYDYFGDADELIIE